MFTYAEKTRTRWSLRNEWGQELWIPALEDYSGAHFLIGVLGTGTRSPVPGKKCDLMARMLNSLTVSRLGCYYLRPSAVEPILVVDARRNGVGGMGSWGPREFSTIIPERLRELRQRDYEFVHQPNLAPSIQLLDDSHPEHMPWREFRKQYVRELLCSDAVGVAHAFVETATCKSGLVIFLCAEAHHPNFDSLPQSEQDKNYCHRFTLARAVSCRMAQIHPRVTIRLVHLDLLDYVLAGQPSLWEPPSTILHSPQATPGPVKEDEGCDARSLPQVRDEPLSSLARAMHRFLESGPASKEVLEERFGGAYWSHGISGLLRYGFVRFPGEKVDTGNVAGPLEHIPESQRCRVRLLKPVYTEYFGGTVDCVAGPGTVWNAFRIQQSDVVNRVDLRSDLSSYCMLEMWNRYGSDTFVLTLGEEIEIVPWSVPLAGEIDDAETQRGDW